MNEKIIKLKDAKIIIQGDYNIGFSGKSKKTEDYIRALRLMKNFKDEPTSKVYLFLYNDETPLEINNLVINYLKESNIDEIYITRGTVDMGPILVNGEYIDSRVKWFTV